MQRRLRLCKHPSHLDAKRFLLLDDWLTLVRQSKKDCVSKMIEMCRDLRANGMDTRFKKHLFGPVFELKGRTSSGGARVYFFATASDEYILVRAECKKEDKASVLILNDVADVLDAYESGVTGLLNPQRRKQR